MSGKDIDITWKQVTPAIIFTHGLAPFNDPQRLF